METKFIKLNNNWNAEPNSPEPFIKVEGNSVLVEFYLNAFRYKQYKEEDKGILIFRNCWRFRMGKVNDKGWHMGQCRFSKIAPDWGNFYKVEGNLLLEECPNDWKVLGDESSKSSHFLFYFHDEEFECDAESFEFREIYS